MEVDNKTLQKYLAEVRRVEESRSRGAEKEIRRLYKRLLKDLNGFVGEYYTKYSDDEGVLSAVILQQKAKYASFLEEVDKNISEITPRVSKKIKKTVEDTYKACYKGMVNAFTGACDSEKVKESFKGLSIKPEVIKAAVENPISGLTLPERLEKNRKEVIYDIKQNITNALMTGERYDTTAKKIAERLDISYGKAVRIVRTESHRVEEKGLMDGAEEVAGKVSGNGLVYAAVWRNMGDNRVRPNGRVHTSKGWKTVKSKTNADHIKMEGQIIEAGGYFDLGHGVKGKTPGESGDAANDINCRCFIEYEMMTEEEFKERGGKFKENRKNAEKDVENASEKDYNNIVENTQKLKSTMLEGDYKEYINLIAHNNSGVKDLYIKYGDGLSKITYKKNSGAFNPSDNSLEFGYEDSLKYNEIHKYSTLAHEYAHYFDDKADYKGLHFNELDMIYNNTKWGSYRLRKVASSSDEFLSAVRLDRESLKEVLTDEIKEDLKLHHASAGVQDAIDGLLAERISWGHGDKYYNRKYESFKKLKDHKGLQTAYKELGFDASNLAKTAKECRIYEAASEMWANIMSAEICGGSELEYVKKYLPNSYDMLLKIIERVE